MSREDRQSLLHEGVSTTTTLSAYVEVRRMSLRWMDVPCNEAAREILFSGFSEAGR